MTTESNTLSEHIDIRGYRPGDEKEIVQLLQSSFDGWPNFDLPCTPLEHWQWKYRDNPQNKILVSLAENNGEIVGCSHALPSRFKVERKIVPCFHGYDLAVHQDFRGLRIAGKIIDYRDDLAQKAGIDFHLFFEMNPLVIRTLKRRQYEKFLHGVSLIVRIRNVDLFFKSNQQKNALLRRYGFHLFSFHNRLRNLLSKSGSEEEKRKGIEILKTGEFDERINIFWNETKDNYDLIAEKNREYLNWRYCDPRSGEYTIRTAEKKDRILGYIVSRKRISKNNITKNSIGYIVDLLTLKNRLDVARALLDDTIEEFDRKSVNLIQSFIIKNHSYEKIFQKRGFLNSRTKLLTLYKNLNSRIETKNLDSPRRIHLQYGDSDWI
jgi:GNAT superfamily N-acetyltransferase